MSQPTVRRLRPLAVSAAAFADLFRRDLFGLVLASAVPAALLLAGGVWAAARWLAPLAGGLLPDLAGWQGTAAGVAETAAGGLAVLAALALALALWPLVAMVVSGLFFDVASGRLETRLLPEAARGRPPAPLTAMAAGLRFARVSLPLNLLALPLYFVPGLNLLVAGLLNGFLLSRENWIMARLRHAAWPEAMGSLRARRGTILLAALPPALLSLVPFAGFLAPLWALATMVRLRAQAEGPVTDAGE